MKNQIFHILRKDVHQHWREIVLSFALIVAYGWHEATRSLTSADMPDAFSFLWQMLPLLLVLSWALLILRGSYAECLVGDRQFWVTRPYQWKQLLAAKVLFVAVFINVPLFILQVFLLWMAGYAPTTHLSGLLGLQLLWVLFLILPMATLAAVTASLGQFMLSMLCVWLYLIAVGSLSSFVPAAGVSGVNSVPGWLCILAVVGIGLAVVLWQYSRRKTAPSRILLLCAGAVVPIIAFVTPHRILIERAYPQATAGQQLPVQLAFDPAKPASDEGGYPEKNKVHIRIPLLVSGIATGNIVTAAGRTVSIQAPGGQHWSSGWHNSSESFLPNRQHDQTTITMDRDLFERVKFTPAKVRITYALEPAHARETIRTVPQGSQFTLPGEGRCSFSPLSSEMIWCVFPLKAQHILVSVKSDEITCAQRQNETPLPAGTTGYGWIWSSAPFGAEFSISPVIVRSLWVNDWGEVKVRDLRPRVCPGTPLTMLTNWEDLPRARTELEIDGIRLADYQLKDARGESMGGFGVSAP
jgi:hypothetical protein